MRNLSIALALLLVGCAEPRTVPPTVIRPQADAAFSRLAQDYIDGYLAWRPAIGTSLGFHQYDGKVTDLSAPSIAAEMARLETFDRRLSELDSRQLSSNVRYDYRILRGAVRRECFAFEDMRIYSLNPMTYAGVLDVNIYIKRNFAPLEDRLRSIIAILNQAPRIMAAARANLADPLPRPQVETAIDQATGAISFLAKDLPAALKDVNNEPLMAEFKAANERAIAELRDYAAYLKERKLPGATAPYALGRAKFVKLLQSNELITSSPEQLLDLGLRELELKQRDFTDTARVIDPGKKPSEVFRTIQKDHPTESNLIPETSRNLESIRQFVIDHHLVTLPSPVRASVTETPQYLRATSFASMDTPGPFETKATEAYYYVTPPEPDWPPQQKEEWLTAFNYYTTDIVSIHEAYPGHYVQFLCLNASPATKLEKIFGSYAFIEGWAHYAEQLMVDEGFAGPVISSNTVSTVGAGERAQTRTNSKSMPQAFASDPVQAAEYRLAQTDEALLRVCRLCVSIKMHCQGMTVEEAAAFFQTNCYYEPKPARQEAIRGAYDPEYLYYTLGKLEILRLRDDYQKRKGANFSLQEFHDELLRHGAPPIPLLREVMLKPEN